MEEFLKLYVKNDTLKDSLNFQMTYINGQIPQLRDSKDYNFSLSRIEKKKDKWKSQQKVSLFARNRILTLMVS